MPTYQYEAMDHTGREVKDSIDAATQEEAQQLIRQKGFFVTKIAEKAKKTRKASAKKGGRRKKKSFTIGKISTKQLCTFTRQLSTLAGRRPADPPQPEDPRGPVQAGRAQERAGRRGRGHRERPDALRGVLQASQGVRPALLQHDQGGRGRRCSRSDPSAPGRLQGKVPVAQAADQVGHGLPDRGHLGRVHRSWASSSTSSSPSSRRSSKTSACPCRGMTIFLIEASHFLIKYFYIVFLTPLSDLDLHQAALSQQDGGVRLRPDLADDSGHGRRSSRSRRWRGPCARWARWCSRACRSSSR